jgi:SAM-dependent methyltransferase
MAATPNYGLEGPRAARDMYQRAAWTLAFALVLYYINHREYPGPSLALAGVITLIAAAFAAAGYGLNWLERTGRLRIREQLLDALELSGSERVLDFGCGLGLLGIGAAKRLTSGKVIAIGETATNETARENAKLEGVADKIRFETGDLNRLSYPDGHFDVVMAGRALATLEGDALRTQAAREMVRLLKAGGRLALHEIGDTHPILALLEQLGLEGVRQLRPNLPLGLGGRILLGRKPAIQK